MRIQVTRDALGISFWNNDVALECIGEEFFDSDCKRRPEPYIASVLGMLEPEDSEFKLAPGEIMRLEINRIQEDAS